MAKQGGRMGRGNPRPYKLNTHACNILFSAGPIPVLAKPTGEEHPTPDSVPARKSSIIQGGFLTLTCPDV